MHFPALRQQFKPLPENEKAHYSAAYLVGGLLSVDRTFRRISTLITCFGFAARCRGLQSPTCANPSRYKVRIVSLTPWGEPTTVTSSTSCSDTAAGSEFGRANSFSSGTNSCDILCSPDFGFSRKTQKSSRPAFQHTAGRPQRMLRYSVSLQTACSVWRLCCPLLLAQLWAVQLDFWATRAASCTSKATLHLKA